uniref:Uncharacterized protein n=1 Tax=Tanacetum cinerariifolium TaxID=118510 RepID=A0A699Q9Z4_TANCI|nr:hypothetical protein [Tanacetum cinerariifolium]
MDAPTIPVSADSFEGNFRDAIDIGLDVDHPVPVVADAFPAVTIVTILASHEEAILGIHEIMEAIETITHSQERRTRMEMEQQLALVQESQREDRENFKKLHELVTSQLGRHP